MTEAPILPAPLVPAEVDLRDFQYMNLDVRVLRDSRFAAQVSGDAFRAGVLLWCAAWHQVPAGSLPDDDIELANLAGYGRFAKEWRKVRAEALTKFVKCSDGRLYHEEVSEKANTAWLAKLHHHYERARDRLRKTNKARATDNQTPLPEFTFEQWNEQRLARGLPMEKADASAGIPQNAPPPSAGIPVENPLKGNGEGTERERNGEGNSSDAGASGATAPLLAKPDLWRAIKGLLEQAGVAKSACGGFITKLIETHGEAVVMDAMQSIARQPPPGDIREYLPATCKHLIGERQKAETNFQRSAREGVELLTGGLASKVPPGAPAPQPLTTEVHHDAPLLAQ